MEYALEIKGLSKRYPDFALEDVTFSLPKGYIMGLVGENGAGKSTTIKLIFDLIKRDGGSVTLLGADNKTDLNSVKEHVGIVLDECCFQDNLNARNINLILKNIYKTWNETDFFDYIRRFSLPEKKMVKEYSRGMKMKLAIAVALSHDSRLLILDEATSGLDPIVRNEILEVFQDFIQDEEHSILMSSHIISDLEKICDYVTFLHKGKIMFSQTKDDLLESHGIVKCSPEEYEALDKSIVKGARKGEFGVEALVLRQNLPDGYLVDPAGIEDIMLYYVKGCVQ